tara:strand:+ start:235 stop:498 length:264 start_codon:yes stop_codon:yes gene_type:complete
MSLQKILDRVSNLKEKLRDGNKNNDVIDWELIDIEQMIASEMDRVNKSEFISNVVGRSEQLKHIKYCYKCDGTTCRLNKEGFCVCSC